MCKGKEIGKKGFTLVELLVVISIIAVLLAIMVPALGKAREAAKTTICKARLRQFGIALRTYGQENNDNYLLHEWYLTGTSIWKPELTYWYARISPYIDVKAKLATSELMRCPSGDAIKDYGREYVNSWYGTDYGLQEPYSQNTKASKNIKISSIKMPYDFSSFFDFFVGNKTEGAIGDGLFTGSIEWGKFYKLVDNMEYLEFRNKVFRHNGFRAINAVYIDGHTSTVIKRQKVWSSLDSPSSTAFDPTGKTYGYQFILGR